MSDAQHPKPRPARPARSPGKPTPVRELSGETPATPPEVDVAEVELEVEGKRWTARVLGRSGGGSSVAAPLLLLGFWTEDAENGPSLEALVVGRSLADMPADSLREALSRAHEPPDPDHKASFFAGASQSRRR